MISPEDCTLGKDYEVKSHDDIDRVRRAHLNDLENVLPFLFIGLFYIFTEPHIQVSSWLFRIAGIGRIAHTIIYAIYPVPQPTRAILFYTVYIISLYMSLSSVVYFFHL
jgi:glutathione S-transferase